MQRLLAPKAETWKVGVLAPLLAGYLFFGTCGGSRNGFVLAFKAGKVAVTAAWCGSED